MLGCGRLFVYQTTSLVGVYVIYGAIIIALGLVNTVFAADTSQIADPSELGDFFGILASVESLAGIAGPILGGALTKVEAERAPLLAVVVLSFLPWSTGDTNE
jgi:MFS family permease